MSTFQLNPPPAQLDRLYDRPRDPPSDPHLHRQQPLKFSSAPSKPKQPKKLVTFNRLQLAAALLEYDTRPEEPDSGIQWDLQEVPRQNYPPAVRNASQSAIFIPYRAAPNTTSARPDFLSGHGLLASAHPKNIHPGSGFGIVNTSVHSPLVRTEFNPRQSMAGMIELSDVLDSHPPLEAEQSEADVLSEWGLDNLLSDPDKADKGKGKASTQSENGLLAETQTAHDHHNTQHRTGRLNVDTGKRQQVKSDLFDFHYSDLRLQTEQLASTPDFLRQPEKLEDKALWDDDELLKQRTWCDPEGRKLIRPQSVLEFKEARLASLLPAQTRATRGRTSSPPLSRGRHPSHITYKGATANSNFEDPTLKLTKTQPQSLPPARLLEDLLSRRPLQSGSSVRLSGELIHPLARRKSAQELSFARPNPNPLQKLIAKNAHRRTKSAGTQLSDPAFGSEKLAKGKSLATVGTDDESKSVDSKGAKLKNRTSADIAQRYQQTITMLEGRMDEDKTFDSKVAFVRSQTDQKASESEPYGPEPDEDEQEVKMLQEEALDQESEDTPIFDELGRIRFPTSLKPPVLIMPIPLTPNEDIEVNKSEVKLGEEDQGKNQATEEGVEGEQEEDPVEETDSMRWMKRMQAERPAGKLYGRSLIDELNSRKGAQKSRQMTFTGDGRRKMFANTLSPSDASRPASIYSNIDPSPEQPTGLPKSVNSPSHLANKALNASQSKFSQALVDSSRARKTVFGMDPIMALELAKLKRIKAAEDAELRETEAKAEAKEHKKRTKKKGKKKNEVEDEEAEKVKLEAEQRLESVRASQMVDHWDQMLVKKSPTSKDASPGASPGVSPMRQSSIPLPIIRAFDSTEAGRIGNMDDWFKDTSPDMNDPSKSVGSLFGADDDDDGFGNANSIARKLELQAEKMNYKPLSNVFEATAVERGHSFGSYAALMTTAQDGDPISPDTTLGVQREREVDEEDGLPLMDLARQRRSQMSQMEVLKSFGVDQDEEDKEDDVPLSQHRKSMMPPRLSVIDDADDNRPLSQHLSSRVLPKLSVGRRYLESRHGALSTLKDDVRSNLDTNRSSAFLGHPVSSRLHSPVSSVHSPGGVSSHSTDEELPLGIRASILLAREHHPPIDLTQDNGSSEGPIGSTGTHETDDVPLGVRASVLMNKTKLPGSSLDRSFGANLSAAFGSSKKDEKEALVGSPLREDDDVPIGHRISAHFSAAIPPIGPSRLHSGPIHLRNPGIETLVKSSNESIGGSSDNVPLGTKYDDDNLPLAARLSTFNPRFPPVGPMYGHMSQFGTSFDPYQPPQNMFQNSFMPVPVQVQLRAEEEDDEDDDVPLAKRASAIPPTVSTKREVEGRASKVGVTIPSMSIDFVPASPLLEGEEELETLEPLASPPGKTTSAGPSPVKAANARADTLAALEGRMNPEENADDDVPLGVTRAAHTSVGTVRRPKKKKMKQVEVEVEVESDDDVPLGVQHPPAQQQQQQQQQQMMMNMLIEQQNSAFGFAMQSMNMMPPGETMMMMNNPNLNGPFQVPTVVEGPDRKTVDQISRWRQDVER